MKSWTDNIDPATIPDEIILRERGRRNALKRATYTGGVYWAKHNPATKKCRCHACMDRRAKEAKVTK